MKQKSYNRGRVERKFKLTGKETNELLNAYQQTKDDPSQFEAHLTSNTFQSSLLDRCGYNSICMMVG